MPATIIAVLLAGNDDTIEQIDPLLEQLQLGIESNVDAGQPAPDVYCYYERTQSGHPAVTGRFRLDAGLFMFDAKHVVTSFSPPDLCGGPLAGDLQQDVGDFLKCVLAELTTRGITGPIRVICGAHGHVSKGISGDRLREWLLKLIDRMAEVELPLDPDLWKDAWWRIGEMFRMRMLSEMHPVCSLYSSVDPGASRLTLDQLGSVFRKLKRRSGKRLQMLLLHACNLSALETMKALSVFPHHVACAVQLSNSPMLFSKWFSTLIDANATDEELTQACFDSLRNDKPNAIGHFSSQRTKDIDAVLRELSRLGKLFLDLLGDPDFENAVANAQADSWGAPHCVDIARFCELLRASDYCEQLWREGDGELRLRLLMVETRVQQLQIQSCLSTNIPLAHPDKNRGINVALPERSTPLAKSDLPQRFVKKAKNWWKFVEQWIV